MAIKKRPVSPRQKMINLMYVVLMAMLALNVSTEVLNGFSIVEESLKRTTSNATLENMAIYDDFAVQMKKNPQKVKEWYDKSQQVKQMSAHLYDLADELKQAIVVEADSVCPNSPYGRTKLAGEEAVTACCKQSMIIRTAWLYSTFGNNFVKTMIRLGNEKPELGVIFDQIGTPTYARDLAIAIFAAINKGIVPGTYHFSNEGVISWYDFTKAIHRIAGITTCHVRPLHTAEYPTPAARPHYSVLDKTKIKQTYGIEIPY